MEELCDNGTPLPNRFPGAENTFASSLLFSKLILPGRAALTRIESPQCPSRDFALNLPSEEMDSMFQGYTVNVPV